MADEGIPKPDPEEQTLILENVGRETLHLLDLLVEKNHPMEKLKRIYGDHAEEWRERNISTFFESMVMSRALNELGSKGYQQACEAYRQEQWRREKAWGTDMDHSEPSP